MTSPDHPVDRLLLAIGGERDVDLVRALDTKAQTVSSWRTRGRVPLRICTQIADRYGVRLEWLLAGRGQMRGGDVRDEGRAVYGPPQRAPPPPPPADRDERLEALCDWFAQWWQDATEDERGWLIVELRVLRARTPPPGRGA